jgi:hypothetical protein
VQNKDNDRAGENIMNEIIEADFFPPAVEEIKEASDALIVDNKPNAAGSVGPSSATSTFPRMPAPHRREAKTAERRN